MCVATVLTACGIETFSKYNIEKLCNGDRVATVLTACGIETLNLRIFGRTCLSCNSAYRLRY